MNAQVDQSSDISELIEKKRDFNKNHDNFIDGYQIQLFNGKEAETRKRKKEFEKDFPEIEVSLFYFNPDWRLRIGNFKTRLEATKVLNKIKSKYRGARILETKIIY
ncbi:SPOR domain-containing protein [Aureivirga marina]|uniref:SPOR domain-containing protein n=1 Tax=Aureivirga marina TaxID=1182451 RepID=UPI0018CB7888|nr:SPOR domain-containing protein [Aureivirga marina]